MPTLLVTVGSTCFPALTTHLVSSLVQAHLRRLGISHTTLQHGPVPHPPSATASLSPHVYLPDLPRAIAAADLVVCHAGAATVLELCDSRKPFVVVVNTSLMNDHQTELADALRTSPVCRVVSSVHHVVDAIAYVLNNSHLSAPSPLPQRTTDVMNAVISWTANLPN